jgi:hypothetical protein
MNQLNTSFKFQGHECDTSTIENSPELESFKKACKRAFTEYKKEFVTIDLRNNYGKFTLSFLFLYIHNDLRINCTERKKMNLLYVDLYPQLSKGIIELDLESLQIIKMMFGFAITNPAIDKEIMLPEFLILENKINECITEKTKQLIVKNHE